MIGYGRAFGRALVAIVSGRRAPARLPLDDLGPAQADVARQGRQLAPGSGLGRVHGPVAVERRVEPALREQLVVRALLDDPAVLEDDDQVGVADRREAVRDDERGPAVQQAAERLLDLALGADVDRARRLVEDQDPRVGEQRARERDELPLAEREP